MTAVETMIALRDKVDTEPNPKPYLVAWRVSARGMPPEYWARSIRPIKDRLTRHRVACLVWWDYFGPRPTKHRWPHLDKLISGFPTAEPVRSSVVEELHRIGYPRAVATYRTDDSAGEIQREDRRRNHHQKARV